jgi:hypothetical protein
LQFGSIKDCGFRTNFCFDARSEHPQGATRSVASAVPT